MEERLREERRFLEGVTDAMGEGMYVLDEAGICVFVNREAERILGRTREELLGKRLHDLIHHQDAHGRPVTNEECIVNRSVQQGNHFRSEQEVFTRPDGSMFPVSVSAVPLREGERVVGSVTVFQDISERLRTSRDLANAKEAAEAANRAKSEFLANMSDVARNGFAAMRYLATAGQGGGRAYDFLLVDWRMRGMDGPTLVEEGKELFGSGLPPVIMTTAYARAELEQVLEERGLAVGAVLGKPVTAEQLTEAIASVLGMEPDSDQNRQQKQTDMTAALRGAHILLVEDNEFNQEVAVALLQQQGIRADLAVNGEEALRMVQAHDYDGVLMDCQMPVMDGYEATRAIRQLPGRGDLPIIAMTANAMREDIAQALTSGMNDHIAKPINVRDMFSIMGRWIRPARPAVDEGAGRATTPDTGIDGDVFSGLQGINVRQGLQRVGGSQASYLRLLHKFADNQGGAIQRARDALQAGKREQLERVFHALKGAAGSIGAIELQRLAAELEVRIKQAAYAVSAQDFDEVERELKQVLQQLEKLPDSLGAKPAPVSEEDVERLLEILQQQLDDFDTAAVQTLERLMPAVQEGGLGGVARRCRAGIVTLRLRCSQRDSEHQPGGSMQ